MGKEKKTKRFYALDYSDQCTKNYYRLLLDYEESIYTAPTNNVERRSNAENIKVGNVVWSKYESNMFFKALARFSKKRPVEIAKWIGTKTPIEVMELIDYYDKEVKLFSELGLLERLCHKDIPAAREMSDEWLEFEASQVEELQKKTERITKIEKKALFNVKHGLIKDGEVDQRKLNLFKNHVLKFNEKQSMPAPPEISHNVLKVEKEDDVDIILNVDQQKDYVTDKLDRLRDEHYEKELKNILDKSYPKSIGILYETLEIDIRDLNFNHGNNTGGNNTGVDGNNTGDDNTGGNNTGVDGNNTGDDNTGGNNTG
ncbi:6183_t:CDS:2, partial [Entrophospora sp. SA101]